MEMKPNVTYVFSRLVTDEHNTLDLDVLTVGIILFIVDILSEIFVPRLIIELLMF